MTNVISHKMSAHGLDVSVTNYGASLQDLRLTDHPLPLVLGFSDHQAYATQNAHMGATAGRYANRIAGGTCQIAGQRFVLDKNEADKHTLHGGRHGCGTAIWTLADCTAHSATFTLTEPDGHMGFPGEVALSCHYHICEDQTLSISYEATTTAPTFINLAHHSYFKLDDQPTICDHQLEILADQYLPVRADNLPVGAPEFVSDTKFDFRSMRAIGDEVFDHNFCLDNRRDMRQIARLFSPHSGIEMTIRSDQAGLQFYNAAHLNEAGPTHHGRAYHGFDAVCLEPQNWPNSPNQPDYPSSLILPNERYEQQLILQVKIHEDAIS